MSSQPARVAVKTRKAARHSGFPLHDPGQAALAVAQERVNSISRSAHHGISLWLMKALALSESIPLSMAEECWATGAE